MNYNAIEFEKKKEIRGFFDERKREKINETKLLACSRSWYMYWSGVGSNSNRSKSASSLASFFLPSRLIRSLAVIHTHVYTRAELHVARFFSLVYLLDLSFTSWLFSFLLFQNSEREREKENWFCYYYFCCCCYYYYDFFCLFLFLSLSFSFFALERVCLSIIIFSYLLGALFVIRIPNYQRLKH